MKKYKLKNKYLQKCQKSSANFLTKSMICLKRSIKISYHLLQVFNLLLALFSKIGIFVE